MQWLWGLLGAFIYAGPRWVRCHVTCRETGDPKIECLLDFVVSLAVGSIAAGAFAPILLTWTGLGDENALSALVGVFVNPVAPELTKRAPKMIVNLLGTVRGLKGDEK